MVKIVDMAVRSNKIAITVDIAGLENSVIRTCVSQFLLG